MQNAFVAQGPSRNVTIFLRAAALLNSHGVSASDWVQALTALTLRTDLPLLTMLPWAQVVSSRQLIHPPTAVVSLLFRGVAGEWAANL